MNHYEFPIISNFSDVERFITDDFRVTEQGGIKYINYNLATIETFPEGGGEVARHRRELRGIAFRADTGEIVSRPFHKFFNVGERSDETLDLDRSHFIAEKLDGSMIRPIRLGPDIPWRLATKAGITDVAMLAETAIVGKQEYSDFFNLCEEQGWTPIFEYCSPDNKIVLDYDEPQLILTAVRGLRTGIYLNRMQIENLAQLAKVPYVIPSPFKPDEVKEQEGTEGIVIEYDSGHRQKVKAEAYLKLHRAKDLMDNERKVVKLWLNEEIDDVFPAIDEDKRDEILAFLSEFAQQLHIAAISMETIYNLSKATYDTKKEFAIATQSLSGEIGRSATFALWDGKVDSGEHFVVDFLSRSFGSQKAYEEAKEKLGVTVCLST